MFLKFKKGLRLQLKLDLKLDYLTLFYLEVLLKANSLKDYNKTISLKW